MTRKALRNFPYYHDGIHPIAVVAGEEVEIRDEQAPGLEAAGYIEPEGERSTSSAASDSTKTASDPVTQDTGSQTTTGKGK